MKKNVGKIDSILRILVAVVVAVLLFAGMVSGVLAIVLGVVGVVMLATAVFRFCPLYPVVGVNTDKAGNGQAK